MKTLIRFFISGLGIALSWAIVRLLSDFLNISLHEYILYLQLLTWPFHILSLGFKYTPEQFFWFTVEAILYNGIFYAFLGLFWIGVKKLLPQKKIDRF